MSYIHRHIGAILNGFEFIIHQSDDEGAVLLLQLYSLKLMLFL